MHALKTAVRFAVALACLLGGHAHAAPPVEATVWKELSVGLLPLLDVQLLDGAPFATPAIVGGGGTGGEAQRTFARRRVEAQGHVVATLSGFDFVKVHDETALRRAMTDDKNLEAQGRLANERLDLGRERWLGLESEAALEQFDRARELLLGAWLDLITPERFAEVEFQRGLALAELNREAEAVAAFRAMFIYEPSRRLTEGWYGDRVDRLLVAAAADARGLGGGVTTRFPPARLKAFAEHTGITHWFIGALMPNSGASDETLTLQLALVTFDAASPDGLWRSGLFAISPLSHASRGRDALGRWLSAWHTCALDVELAPLVWRPQRRRTIFLDLAYRHSVWINHRQTRDYLHGPGFQVGLTWEPAPLVQVWARLAQASTLIDSRGDLLNEFGTTHIAMGGALRVGSERFTASLRFGLDAAISLNDFEATYDIDCKFFGADSPRCGGVFSAPAPLVWFGFDAGISLRWRPHTSWYMTFATGMSVYVVEPSAARELNYPLYGSLGVGAAF